MSNLNRLVAEASVLAGGKYPCAVLGHKWLSAGGRPCPYSVPYKFTVHCSQTVYECGACGDTDYGDPGGPGHRDCVAEGPCSRGCEEARAELSEPAPHE